MNQINLTTFVQDIIDDLNKKYHSLRQIVEEDRITGPKHYKKIMGQLKSIRECHDLIISKYNSTIGSLPSVSKEPAPRIDSITPSSLEPVLESTPAQGA